MKKQFIIIINLVLLTVFMSSCGNKEEAAVINERIISVKAELIKPRNIQITKVFTGSIEGEKQAVIYAKITEAIESVNISEGEIIEAGKILINLDKSGSNYFQTKSLSMNSEKNFKKMEYLFGEGAVSESDFDAAKTDYEVNKASFDAASKLVNIESPISGMVTALEVSEGDFVRVGQKLATIAATSNLRVRFLVNALDIKDFSKNDEVFVSSDVSKTSTVGKVVSVASSANPETRAFEVEVLLDNKDNNYKPGMFVRITFVKESLENVIAVPRKSVLTLNDKETVFIVKNGLSEKREVSLGEEAKGLVVVTSGLNINDTLVTLGQDYLGDNTRVNITELNEGVK